SGRLSALRPPLVGAGKKKEEATKKKEKKGGGNEAKHHGQQFIALSSPRKRGPITPGRSRGPGSWVPAFAGTTGRGIHPGLFDIVNGKRGYEVFAGAPLSIWS